MSSMLKNLIIALGITVLIGGGYLFVVNTQGVPEGAEGATRSDPSTLAIDTERVLSDIATLAEYTLDTGIFMDTKFTSLRDYTVEIIDVPSGRPNPFAPVQ